MKMNVINIIFKIMLHRHVSIIEYDECMVYIIYIMIDKE